MIEFQSITHSYGEAEVLDDISFTVGEGECVGLTGPSGCGKSTLAHIAAGYLIPTEGRVLIDGENVTGRPGRRVFTVHQDSDLFAWQTVEQHISFALEEENPEKVSELITLVKLTGSEKHYPRELSGGMKRRLALARALAINPELLILDESFSSLDSSLKEVLYQDLKTIWEVTRTTILLITHDSRELKHLAGREVLLSSHKPTTILEIKNL